MRAVALVAGVGLCLVVATASALTPRPYVALGQAQFHAIAGSRVGGDGSPGNTGQGQRSGTHTTPPAPAVTPSPSTRPAKGAPTARPLRTYFRQSVSGVATWQPLPGLFGSAGPVLRGMGVKVGQTVRVCSRGNCVAVTIWPGGCWCKARPGGPTLIDLSHAAFSRLADPSLGIVEVNVSW